MMFNLLPEEELVTEMNDFAGATDEQLHAFKTIVDAYDSEVKLLLSGVNKKPSQGCVNTYTTVTRLAGHLTALQPILENNSLGVDDVISLLGTELTENLVKAGVLCEVTSGYETDHYAVTGKAYRLIKVTYGLEKVIKDISKVIKDISQSK